MTTFCYDGNEPPVCNNRKEFIHHPNRCRQYPDSVSSMPFHLHTYIHIYIHTYIPIYIPTHIHTYVHRLSCSVQELLALLARQPNVQHVLYNETNFYLRFTLSVVMNLNYALPPVLFSFSRIFLPLSIAGSSIFFPRRFNNFDPFRQGCQFTL